MSARDQTEAGPDRAPAESAVRARKSLKFRDTGLMTERVFAVISPLMLLAVWEVMARLGWIDVRFFPAPTAIIRTMVAMIRTGELFRHLGASLVRIFWGFLLGGIPALAMGLIMGLSRGIRAAINPLVAAIYPIPKIAILPLIMLIFGLSEMSKYVTVAIGVFFPVLINTITGVMNIEKIYLDVGKNFRAGRWATYLTIALPGALPVVFTGFRLGWGIALLMIVAAEFVGAKSGIGYLIWQSWQTFTVEEMYVGLFVVSLLGYISTLALD